MDALVPDSEPTHDAHLNDWRAFCRAYYGPIVRALRLLRLTEDEAEELAHSFLVKASEKAFLENFHAFRAREAHVGRHARFRYYLYRSLRNHVADVYRQRAARLGERAVSPEILNTREAAATRDGDALYALDVLHQALQALRHHCERSGKPHFWTFFEETFLADEFLGRRALSRAELLARTGGKGPQYLDNALTTTKRAFRRFVHEILAQWPDRDLDPRERFAEWMTILRESRASRYDLLHLAYRVIPLLGDGSIQSASSALVVGAPGRRVGRPGDAGADEEPGDDELSILLSFRLEVPLALTLDLGTLDLFIPHGGRSARADRLRKTLSLLTLIDPSAEEVEILAGVDALGLLARLKDWAKQLHHSRDHAVPEVLAELLYTTVNVLALVRYGVALHSIGPARLAGNVKYFLGRPWLDARLRPLLDAGLATLQAPEVRPG